MEPENAKLQQVCRICLLHYKGTMTDIHHKPEKSCRIRDVLQTCVPFQISEDDKFPRFMCAPCLIRLQTASQFRSIAVQNDKYLRSIMNKCPDMENIPVIYERKITAALTVFKPIIKFTETKNGNASDKNILKLSNHSNKTQNSDKTQRSDENNEATAEDNSQNKGTELVNHKGQLTRLLRNDTTITSDKENDQTSQQITDNALQVCEIITIDDDEDIPQQSEPSVAQNQTTSKEQPLQAVDVERMRIRLQTIINNKIKEIASTNNNLLNQDHNHNVNINEQNGTILQQLLNDRSMNTSSGSEVMQQNKQNPNSSLISQNEKQNTDRNNLIGIQNQFQPRQSVINSNVSKSNATVQVSTLTNSIAVIFQDKNVNNTQLPNCATTAFQQKQSLNKPQPSVPVTVQNQHFKKTLLLNSVTTGFLQNQNVNRIQQPIPATANYQQTQTAKKTQPPNSTKTGCQQTQFVNKTPSQNAVEAWNMYKCSKKGPQQVPVTTSIQSQINSVTNGSQRNQNVSATQHQNSVAVGFQQNQNVAPLQTQINSVTNGSQRNQNVSATQHQNSVTVGFQQNQNVAPLQTQINSVTNGSQRNQNVSATQHQNSVAVGFQQNQNVAPLQTQINSVTNGSQRNQNVSATQHQNSVTVGFQQNQNVAPLQTQINSVTNGSQRNQNVSATQHQNSVAVGFQQNQNVAPLQTQINSAPGVFPPNQNIAQSMYSQSQLMVPTSLQNQNIANRQMCETQSGISSQQPLPQIQNTNVTVNQNVSTVTYNVQQPRNQNNEPSRWPIPPSLPLQKTYYTQNVNQTTNSMNTDRPRFDQNPSTNNCFNSKVPNVSVLSFQNVVTGTNQSQPGWSQNMTFAVNIQAPQQSQNVSNSQTLTYPQHNTGVNLRWPEQDNSVPISYASSQPSQLQLAQSLNHSSATAVQNQSLIVNASDNIPNSVLYARTQLAALNLRQIRKTANQAAITNTVSSIGVKKPFGRKSLIPILPKSSIIVRTSTSTNSLPINSVTTVTSNTVNVATDTMLTSNRTHTISVISPERINKNLLAGRNIGINIAPPENRNPIQNAEIDSSDNLISVASEVGITSNAQQVDNIPGLDSRIASLNCIDNLLHSLEQAHQSTDQNTECENEYIPLDTGFARNLQKSTLIHSDIDRNDSLLAVTNALPKQKVSIATDSSVKISDVKSELEKKVTSYRSVNVNDSNEVKRILGGKRCVVVLNSIPLQYRHLLKKTKPAAKRKNSFDYEIPSSTSSDDSSDEDWIAERKRKRRTPSNSSTDSYEDWIAERKRKRRTPSSSSTDSSNDDWLQDRKRKHRRIKKNHSVKSTRKKQRRLIFSDEESFSSASDHRTDQPQFAKHRTYKRVKLKKNGALNNQSVNSVPNIPSDTQTKETSSVSNLHSTDVSKTDSNRQTDKLLVTSQKNLENDFKNSTVDQNIHDNESNIIKNEDNTIKVNSTDSTVTPIIDGIKKTKTSDKLTVDREIYKSQRCNKDFVTEEVVKKHICEFPLPKHSCYKCSKRFTKIIDLQMHLGTKHCEEFQVCKKCSKVFNMLMHYLDHSCDKNAIIVEHDLKDSPYNCGVCSGNFNTVESFIKHYNDLHG